MSNFWNLKRKIFLLLIGILFLLNIVAWKEVFVLAGPHYLKVDVLDIGQGDSIFIETPSMRRILIDGGPDTAVLGKLAERLPFWEKSLDVVVLTHPDQDHIMGLLSVLQKYKVKYIVWTGMVRGGANYQKWIELISKKQKEGSNIVITDPNTKITSGNVFIETLNPRENLQGKYFSKADNDTGIVLHLLHGKNTFLFTADTSSKVEEELVANNAYLPSDVLKVPHHGSKYSSSETFLRAVNPKIAIISVGKYNSYGHPTQEVLQRLQNFGITMFRTDQDGDVEILSDGNNLRVNKEK